MPFRTFIVWTMGLIATLVLFPFAILGFILDRSGNGVHRVGALWCKIILMLSGVKVVIKGIENIKEGPLIFASNHKGAFDIPVLQSSLPMQFRWVAKKSLFKIPFVGWAMSLSGYVSIDKKDTQSAYKSIDDAAELVRGGTSILIFPEGTRNSNERLLPFRRGGFMIASRSGVPIIPVAIKDTENIMKRGSILISPSVARVCIGHPIEVKGKGEKELMDITKNAIEEGLKGL